MNQRDIEYLDWMADRLVHVYHESPNTDFVHAARRVAKQAREDQKDQAAVSQGTCIVVCFLFFSLLISLGINYYLLGELRWWRCERPYVQPESPTLVEPVEDADVFEFRGGKWLKFDPVHDDWIELKDPPEFLLEGPPVLPVPDVDSPSA